MKLVMLMIKKERFGIIEQSSKVYASRQNYKFGYVYKIINTKNSKVYIGSTINFKKRKSEHFTALNNNRHVNKHLQYAWNKYGGSVFIIIEIECVLDVSYLTNREQYWMDSYDSYNNEKGYNINKSATSSLGRVLSNETKSKISISHIKANRTGSKSIRWGAKLSNETKLKISEAGKKKIITQKAKDNLSKALKGKFTGEKHPNAILTPNNVKEIKLLWKYSDMSTIDISKFYPVSKSGIGNIVYGKKWSHIKIDEFTELSPYLLKLVEKNELNYLINNKHKSSKSKLTKSMIKDIMILLNVNDITKEEIAKLFHVKVHTIWSIDKKRTFKDIINSIKITNCEQNNYNGILEKYNIYNNIIREM